MMFYSISPKCAPSNYDPKHSLTEFDDGMEKIINDKFSDYDLYISTIPFGV